MATFKGYTLFYKQLFYKQRQVETVKRKQAKAKQHPDAENYSLSSFTLSSRNNRRYSKKCTKSKFLCLMWLSD